MTQQSETFGIVFENIPIINLRNEIVRYYATLDQRGANSRGIGEGVCVQHLCGIEQPRGRASNQSGQVSRSTIKKEGI